MNNTLELKIDGHTVKLKGFTLSISVAEEDVSEYAGIVNSTFKGIFNKEAKSENVPSL